MPRLSKPNWVTTGTRYSIYSTWQITRKYVFWDIQFIILMPHLHSPGTLAAATIRLGTHASSFQKRDSKWGNKNQKIVMSRQSYGWRNEGPKNIYSNFNHSIECSQLVQVIRYGWSSNFLAAASHQKRVIGDFDDLPLERSMFHVRVKQATGPEAGSRWGKRGIGQI